MTQTSATTTKHPTTMHTTTMTALFFANSHRPTWIPFCARMDFHNRPAREAEKLYDERESGSIGFSPVEYLEADEQVVRDSRITESPVIATQGERV